MFSLLAFKSLRRHGGTLASPQQGTPWMRAYIAPLGETYRLEANDADLKRGVGIFAASYEEASQYGGDVYLVAPDPARPVVEAEAGWRASAAFVVAGPFGPDNIDEAAQIIVAAHRAGYPQIERILFWAAIEILDAVTLYDIVSKTQDWEILHLAARRGRIPADFDRWELADEDGWTIAHAAAKHGHLPADFDRWEIANVFGWTVAHEAARYGHLPPDFDRWELADKDDWAVAYVAAQYGHLPAGFDRWEIANECGWTVAHVAAVYGHLPPDFDRWELANNSGWTIAHEAAECGHLPAGFDRWELADETGRTVAHVAAQYGHLPPDFNRWELTGNERRSNV